MDSQMKLIFVCFIINSINVRNVSAVDANELGNLVYFDDSEVSKMSAQDIFNLHHAFVEEKFKWKDGQINFKIDKNFNDDEIDKILAAMYEIEYTSCVRFAAHDPGNGPDYVTIKKIDDTRFGSSSEVGCRHTGEQFLTLMVDMVDEHQTILHELLHTIGFHHHHQRSDRDYYIELHLENSNLSDADIMINFVKRINFDQRTTYLTPFDFTSVMLYDENDFSTNNKSVITSKIEGAKMPTFPDRVRRLSVYDKILLNRFYDCHIVDKKRSKFFYENEVGMLYPMVVNYHEIHRAKGYMNALEWPHDEANQIDYKEKYFSLLSYLHDIRTNASKQYEENQVDENVNDSVDYEAEDDAQKQLQDNEEEHGVEQDANDGQDEQNKNSTDGIVESYDKNPMDKLLHEEKRIEENLLDGNDTKLAKNEEGKQVSY